jgi:type II secretory pathway component PulM
MLSSLQTVWNEREPREQILLAIMGALLGIFILWQFLLTPVFEAKSDAKAALVTAERDYVAVARALPQLSAPQTLSGQPFSQAILIETARKWGLNPSRVQPDGNRSLSVWIDTKDTQALYGLLTDVITKNGAKLSRASIATTADQNLTAQLTFTLAN